ncbi:polysaccharide pyruvyl transferase family protein [Campylobacter coli]|nr:polysaccharide pyruvyl transferase family protein [Campylobacter coli]HEB9340360.1 polysaccharide pyruvyl transferase family protein [Campylobacter coli]
MKNLNVFYWLGEKNFGDMLNINICNKLFNINPIETSPELCEAVFIGSVLDDFLYKGIFTHTDNFKKKYNQKVLKIWGSGFIANKNQFIRRRLMLPEIYFRRFEAFAVRGAYSKERLEYIGKKKLNNIVLADPGILTSFLVDKIPDKKYKYGIIPHHIELEMDIWSKFKDNGDIKIIRVDIDPLETVMNILECENIFSSALHGLIAADAFGIPNCRIIVSNKLIGGDYKFNDYYSSYGIANHNREIFNIEFKPYDLKNKYNISNDLVKEKQQQLIQCFPFKNDGNMI